MSKPSGKQVGGVGFASAVILAFLLLWESSGTRVLTVFADELAYGLPTVCNGITKHVTDTPIVVGETWTEEKCIAEESRALEAIQSRLLRCFRATPPQSVFDAATSHAWNVGVGGTCGSAAMRAWNAGEWALGCRRIARADSGRRVWSFAGGKFVQGLANRRDDEVRLCMRDVK